MSEVKTKIIAMTVAGRELSFEPNKTAYNALINEITPKNKMAPMVTYLGRIVTPETKPTLTQLLDDVPGVELQVAEAVNEIYAPVVEIEIKN